MIPNGGNGMPAESPLLTPVEAAYWLRIVEPDAGPSELRNAERAVLRLVREHGLTPITVGRAYRFDHDELKRWTEASKRAHVARSLTGSDCDPASQGNEP